MRRGAGLVSGEGAWKSFEVVTSSSIILFVCSIGVLQTLETHKTLPSFE